MVVVSSKNNGVDDHPTRVMSCINSAAAAASCVTLHGRKEPVCPLLCPLVAGAAVGSNDSFFPLLRFAVGRAARSGARMQGCRQCSVREAKVGQDLRIWAKKQKKGLHLYFLSAKQVP
jgi:hypothetical protein